jgi:hypothetical protein
VNNRWSDRMTMANANTGAMVFFWPGQTDDMLIGVRIYCAWLFLAVDLSSVYAPVCIVSYGKISSAIDNHG